MTAPRAMHSAAPGCEVGNKFAIGIGIEQSQKAILDDDEAEQSVRSAPLAAERGAWPEVPSVSLDSHTADCPSDH